MKQTEGTVEDLTLADLDERYAVATLIFQKLFMVGENATDAY